MNSNSNLSYIGILHQIYLEPLVSTLNVLAPDWIAEASGTKYVSVFPRYGNYSGYYFIQ